MTAVIAFVNVKGESLRPLVTLDKRRRRLSSVVARYAPNRPFLVSVHRREPGASATVRPTDDTVRLRKQWSKTFIGQHHLVLITVLPLGGGSSGGSSGATTKTVGMALAAVALAITAPAAVGAIPGLATATGLTLAGQLVSAGLIVGEIFSFKNR